MTRRVRPPGIILGVSDKRLAPLYLGERDVRRILYQAMNRPDDLVVQLDYTDSKGIATRRVVSPIRFLSQDRFLALCLCREEPRQFYLNRCRNLRLKPACEVLMPVGMGSDE